MKLHARGRAPTPGRRRAFRRGGHRRAGADGCRGARHLLGALLLGACLAAGCATLPVRPGGQAPGRLLARTYAVPPKVGALVVDGAAFAAFSRHLRSDLERQLASASLRGAARRDRLFVLAMLDALDDRWASAVAALDRIAALEEKPAAKVMRGLTIRIWAAARSAGGGVGAFRAALERRLAKMPMVLVRADLSMLRTMARVFTPQVCRQLIDREIGPRVRDGTVRFEQVQAIVFQRYAARLLVPVGAVIDAVLGARGIPTRGP